MKKVSGIFVGVLIAMVGLTYFFPKDTHENVILEKREVVEPKINKPIKRWYNSEQVLKGKEVFLNNCAACHGNNAEKTVDWKQMMPDGTYPPPPLNDKAHAWHHPYSQLSSIINNGGKSYGGKMPAFKDTLSQEEIDSAIAFFQSFWSDKYYGYWLERGGK